MCSALLRKDICTLLEGLKSLPAILYSILPDFGVRQMDWSKDREPAFIY